MNLMNNFLITSLLLVTEFLCVKSDPDTGVDIAINTTRINIETEGYLDGKYVTTIRITLCILLIVVLIIATVLYFILLLLVTPTLRNGRMSLKLRPTSKMSDEPGDVDFNELLVKTPQDMENEFNLLDVCFKSNHSKNIAMEPHNRLKNRYVDILPYDYNRVIINSGDNDYINASLIQDPKSNQKYIACQGPMHSTCNDMWQMILDHNVISIVMLCRIFENDKMKCEMYYPNNEESMDFDNITITNDGKIIDEERLFTIRRLKIVKGDLTKTINHYQFHDWPDFGTPEEYSKLLGFCLEVQAKSPDDLVVVHCSAGVGRTGTFIACDMLLRQIHQNAKVNVFKTVLNLREQRKSMVQTQAQYNFIYGVLACEIQNIRKNMEFKKDETIFNDSKT